jgi:release factor glutamine methyltransferase
MSQGTVTWRTLWSETAAVVGSRPEARWLCEIASGLDGDEFLAELDEPATERMVHHLDAMLERWRAGEPLQYVLGRWSFRCLDLLVDRRVLIPRPETEQLVDVAIGHLRGRTGRQRIVDLGTGSGAIGLALASELPIGSCEVWLTDVSADALDVARANLAGLGRAGAAVRLAHGWWFDALPADLRGTFDLVVSNPPYVDDDDPALEAIVRDWEPASALFGGEDGLDHVRGITGEAIDWLAPGGWLVLEIGASQGDRVADLLTARGYDEVVVRADLAGRDRIASARRRA